MRRPVRRKLLPKPPMSIYLTLDEIRESGKPADPDLIAPKDKQRICVAAIGALDDLDPAIRRAITEAKDNPIFRFSMPDGTVKTVDYVQMAVIMIDMGKTVEQIVANIRRVDASAIEQQRAKGVYAPKT
jgi:hypothetical protein